MIPVDTMKNIQAVVFDIGGTLLDFDRKESYAELKEGARLAHGHLVSAGFSPPSVDRYRRRIIGRLARAYLWSRMTGAELDPMREFDTMHRSMGFRVGSEDAIELARKLYSPNKALAHAHPDTANTLETLRSLGLKLALISNTIAPPSGIEDHLTQEGLLDFFPVRIYSCVVGVPKPNRRIFNVALEKLGIPPDRTLYVGDKPAIDVFGAKRVGMKTALRTDDARAKRKHEPDICIPQIKDLLQYFDTDTSRGA